MAETLKIERTATEDGPLLFVGPKDPETGAHLAVPATFERIVSGDEGDLRITLTCAFTGQRVEVVRLEVVGSSDRPVATRDLTQLALPSAIQAITYAVVPNSTYWTTNLDNEKYRDLKSNRCYLAQIYWLKYISHGSPRQALMELLGMPRSTCNVLIRSLNRDFGLPLGN